MKKNIGLKDRFIRLLLSVVLLGCALWLESWLALVFAAFALLEAASSWCIVYHVLGKTSLSKTSCTKHKCLALLVSILFINSSLSAWWTDDDRVYVEYYDDVYVDDGYYFSLSDGTHWVTFDPMIQGLCCFGISFHGIVESIL